MIRYAKVYLIQKYINYYIVKNLIHTLIEYK